VTKESLSSVDVWTHPAESKFRSEALNRSANKQPSEPYALWERKGKTIFASDVKDLSLEDLDVLASDMQVKINELNSDITTEYARLASVPETQPSVADRLRLAIRSMVRKKKHAQTIWQEAARQKRYLNKDKHEHKPKHKQKPKPKPKIVSSQRDYEHLACLDSKMRYFKNVELRSLVSAEIGAAKLETLEGLALKQAIPVFQAWAASTNPPPKLVAHILQESFKHISDSA
jgi:hypothetical protein